MNFFSYQPDPKRHRFPIPNDVWKWELKSQGFAILAYLCFLHVHCNKDASPSADKIASLLHMSKDMSAKQLSELNRRGLLDQHMVPILESNNKNFFSLPNELFFLNIGHGAITVYAYLLYCENRRTHQCHPSCRTIAAAVHLSAATVMKHITKLEDIPPNHFRWYAAYHDEGDHPHVHMMAWSTVPSEAYLTKEGIRQIKSKLMNQIFKQETLHTYEQKSQSRDELVREARRAIRRLTREMAQSICSAPEIEQKMEQLAGQLETVKGKKSYGYLPKSVKKTVDEVVDRLEELPVVKQCYDQWCVLQSEVDSYYHDNPREKKKLSQEKEFWQIKNAVIQEAERIRLEEITFEDADLSDHDEPERLRGESYACWELRQMIQDDTLPLADRDGAAEELERLAERGDAHAQFLLGQLYRDGPLLIPDSQKAKDWFTQAAEHGLPEAQYALGKLFLTDDHEVRDPDEGIRWLEQAARNRNSYAAYRLGKEYLTGEVLTKDTPKAAKWFTRSAEAGNQYAQYMLGKLYLTGQGVTHDQTQAMDWFSRSAAQGNQYAQFFLEHQNGLHPPSVMLAVTRLLYHMSRIFEAHSLPQSSAGLHVDRKLRRKIQGKKIAMDHKSDDHAEEQNQGGMVMGGM